MTDSPIWHPDLLRRFVSTPYVFKTVDGPNRICIESNDLEIALSVRDFIIIERQGNRAGSLLCRIIRDTAAPVEGSEISIVSDGALRVLHLGRGTILVHDQERSELLGFVSSNVKTKELVSSLIPALMDLNTEE
jgi:hypothetical protein